MLIALRIVYLFGLDLDFSKATRIAELNFHSLLNFQSRFTFVTRYRYIETSSEDWIVSRQLGEMKKLNCQGCVGSECAKFPARIGIVSKSKSDVEW